MPHVRKGDLVVVISGAYKGKRGKVLRFVGDRVEIMEHRPISKDKRWKVIKLIARAVQE